MPAVDLGTRRAAEHTHQVVVVGHTWQVVVGHTLAVEHTVVVHSQLASPVQ